MMDRSDGGEAGTADLRAALAEALKGMGALTNARVEAAFRAIPRHHFLPDVGLERVYRDEAIPTKLVDGIAISSSSQPAIMAIMLEQLDVRPGHRVLEIGAGTGYNAALLTHLVGEGGSVITVDIDDDIVHEARAHLDAAGVSGVRVERGDGGLGWPEGAPYDRIILTVGAPDILPAWWEQLRPGGRLVLPLSLRGPQVSVAFEHRGDRLDSISVKPCGFMTLRGAFAGDEVVYRLGPEPGLSIMTPTNLGLDPDAVFAALTGPSVDIALPVPLTLREAFDGLRLWLGLHEPACCMITAHGAPAARETVPLLFRWSEDAGAAIGLASRDGLCLLVQPSGDTREPAATSEPPPIRLRVRSFPPDQRLAERLIALVQAWDVAGQPGTRALSVQAYRRDVPEGALPAGTVLENRFTRLVLSFAPN